MFQGKNVLISRPRSINIQGMDINCADWQSRRLILCRWRRDLHWWRGAPTAATATSDVPWLRTSDVARCGQGKVRRIHPGQESRSI